MTDSMKMAVLADIHSNADALEAVIADALKQGADGFLVAGDIVSDGPSPNEALELVLGLACPVVMGNREDYLLRLRRGECESWRGSKQMASLLWTYENLNAGGLDDIAGLPEQATQLLCGGTSVRVVHGSPFSMVELLKPDEDMAAVERAALAVREQALVFGHNHMQWAGTVHGRLLLNPGSVGVHFNRECMAEYGMLTCKNGKLAAELRRVPYDFPALERRLAGSGLICTAPVWPKITFEGVKAGRNYCLEFLRDANTAMAESGIAPGPVPNDVWDSVAIKWWKKMGWDPYPD